MKNEIEKAEKIRAEVESLNLIIVRSASDTGILYGSVTTRDIANLIGENGITLSRRQIALDKPIKELGLFDMSVILHPEVESKVPIVIRDPLSEHVRLRKIGGVVFRPLLLVFHNPRLNISQ